MPEQKFDGVIEAAHYSREGQIEWVRVFLRRGKTFTDRIIIDRKSLIESLKSGKKFFVGQRVPLQASTFILKEPVIVIEHNHMDVLSTGNLNSAQDQLDQVPKI